VCVLELASMLAGERFGDRPAAVCPVLGALLREYNDAIDDTRRQDLYRYASDSVGTRAGYVLERRRASLAIAWARARYDARRERWRGLTRNVEDPDLHEGPERIAAHVVSSIRRHSDSTHRTMLRLLDQLVALRPAWAAVGSSAARSSTSTPACAHSSTGAKLAMAGV
jgi:hypothetical protein